MDASSQSGQEKSFYVSVFSLGDILSIMWRIFHPGRP
jgi:hypothetical protein